MSVRTPYRIALIGGDGIGRRVMPLCQSLKQWRRCTDALLYIATKPAGLYAGPASRSPPRTCKRWRADAICSAPPACPSCQARPHRPAPQIDIRSATASSRAAPCKLYPGCHAAQGEHRPLVILETTSLFPAATTLSGERRAHARPLTITPRPARSCSISPSPGARRRRVHANRPRDFARQGEVFSSTPPAQGVRRGAPPSDIGTARFTSTPGHVLVPIPALLSW